MVGFLFALLAFLAAVGAAFGALAAVTMLLARLTVGSFVFGWTGVNLSCQAISEIGCRLGQLGLAALTLLARHSFWEMLPFGKMRPPRYRRTGGYPSRVGRRSAGPSPPGSSIGDRARRSGEIALGIAGA